MRGTGLGLATVYGIVKQTDGYVWVYSERGRGSTFKVYLPRAVAEASAAQTVVTSRRPAMGTETLLVVEDQDSVRLLTRVILERVGYHVLESANADQAEELFLRHRDAISMVVTDVVMPGLSGPKLFERLVAVRPGLRVLYVSGFTDSAIVHQGQLAAGVDFLPKPFTAEGLSLRVREILDR